jgi:predicted PurR-regulated permease PerM
LFEIARGTQSLIVLFTVGGFISIGLDRPISKMHRRWKVPRVAGTTIVLGLLVAIVSAVVVLGGPSITNSAATVTKQAPEAVRSMESLPLVGRLLERNGAPDKVEHFLATLPDRLRESNAVERVASAAGDGAAGAFWTISFMLAILWDGPRLVRAARDRVTSAKRQRAVRFGRAAYTALSNVVAAAVFVAALNGTVVMLLAIALGIPSPRCSGCGPPHGTSSRRSAASSGRYRSSRSASARDRGPGSSRSRCSSRTNRSRTMSSNR